MAYHVNYGHCKWWLHVNLKIIFCIHHFGQAWAHVRNVELPGKRFDSLRRFGILGAKKQENSDRHLITNCSNKRRLRRNIISYYILFL